MSAIAAAIAGSAIVGLAGANRAAKAQSDASDAQIGLSEFQYYQQNKKAQRTAKQVSRQNRKTFADTMRGAGVERNALRDYARGDRDTALGLADRAYGRNLDILRDTRGDVLRGLQSGRDSALSGFQPYLGAGTNALEAYASELGIGNRPKGFSGLSLSPAARFLMDEGRTEIEGGAAARGMLDSGATLAALERKRMGLAAQDRDNQLAQLLGLAGMGQSAAGSIAGIESDFGGKIADARGRYAGAIAGLNDTDYARRAGIMGNFYDDMGRAQVGYTDRTTNAGNIFADRTANNLWNKANAGASASNLYTSTASNALAAGGAAQAGAWINGANAINSGIGNFAYGLGGGFGDSFPGQNWGNQNVLGSTQWPMNKPPMARPF